MLAMVVIRTKKCDDDDVARSCVSSIRVNARRLQGLARSAQGAKGDKSFNGAAHPDVWLKHKAWVRRALRCNLVSGRD